MHTGSLSALLILLLPIAVSALYVYKGDPFQPGPLPVSNLTIKESDGIRKRTFVFFPAARGVYVPVLFIPGVFGAVYTEWYSTVLTNLASHGVIVAGVDVWWPLLEHDPHREGSEEWKHSILEEVKKSKVSSESAELFQVVQWLVENLNQKMFPSHNHIGVEADWDRMGIMSHSLGAMFITEMLQTNSTFAKAAAFLDPASTVFKQPLNYTLPALAYGTQMDMEKPACCKMGLSYFHYYSMLTCPKILMNVTGFGHCDINDNTVWEWCRRLHFCKTDPSNNRDLYRKVFVPGVLTSFFGTFLQGNPDLVSYITHRDNMPLPLGQLWFDLNCTTPLVL